MKRLLAAAAALVLAAFFCVPSSADGVPCVSAGEIYVASSGGPPWAARQTDGELTDVLVPGDTVYLPIENAARAEDLDGLRATAEWSEGEQFVGVPLIQYRMVYDAEGLVPAGYRFVVALPISDILGAKTGVHRLRGRIDVGRRFSEKNSVQIFATIQDGRSAANADAYYCNAPSSVLRVGPDRGAIRIQFGADARFDVDAQGQGAIDVGYSAAPLTDIMLTYPDVPLRFLSWSRTPIFNRTGTLFLFGEAEDFLYEVTPSGLTPSDAQYSAEEHAFALSTRSLGCYVIAPYSLDGLAQTPVHPNPPTLSQ